LFVVQGCLQFAWSLPPRQGTIAEKIWAFPARDNNPPLPLHKIGAHAS
jgi:hypothetical protein